MAFVYILKSSRKKWYYVGSTTDLKRRVLEHNAGKVRSTKFYTPLELVFKREFGNKKDARMFEQRLKGKRTEKETIIKEIEKTI